MLAPQEVQDDHHDEARVARWWTFHERMFLYLGGAVAVIGAAGLLAGAGGIPHAADALAVVAGLVMISIITLYAQGRFASPAIEQPVT